MKRRGEFAIDSSVSFLLIAAMLVLALTVFQTVNQIGTLNTIANELARFTEMKGSVAEAERELNRLCQSTGISCDMKISGNIQGGKIQQGEGFEVTLSSKAYIGIGGLFKIPIPIYAKSMGRGERLWK